MKVIFHDRKALILASVLAVASSISSLCLPWVTERLITSMRDMNVDGIWLLVIISLVIGTGIADSLKEFVVIKASETAALKLRSDLISRIVMGKMTDLTKFPRGDLISRITVDVGKVQTVFSSGVFDIAGSLTLLSGGLVMMARIDALMLIAVLVILVTISGILFFASVKVEKLTQAAQERVGSLCTDLENTLSGIKTIKALKAESVAITRTITAAGEVRTLTVKIGKMLAVLMPLSKILIYAAFLSVLFLGAYRVFSGALSVGSLIAFGMLVFIVATPLSSLTSLLIAFRTGSGALARLQEISKSIDLECSTSIIKDHPNQPRLIRGKSGLAIEFKDVSLVLEGHRILNNVSFHIPAGAQVALVGASGCGKTTCLAILERFYVPTSGEVLLDEVPLREFSLGELRSLVRYQEQDAPMFPGTIRSNLNLGNINAKDHELEAALSSVSLAEEVHLRGGLDADIREHGLDISGGQRQRLALARLFLSSSPVVLLDESTSQVDELTEGILLETLRDYQPEATVLLVTHRLSVAKQMDFIILLNEGSVVASGTHKELMKTSPQYRSYANL